MLEALERHGAHYQIRQAFREKKYVEDQIVLAVQRASWRSQPGNAAEFPSAPYVSHEYVLQYTTNSLSLPFERAHLERTIVDLVAREHLEQHADDPHMYKFLP